MHAFFHALLKKAKRHLNECMPTPPDIEQAISIGSFGANLETYYLQLSTIGITFEDKKIAIFLSVLQQKGIEVDIFVNRKDNVTGADPLPDELMLTELILSIKDIISLQNSSATVINRVCHDTQNNATSTPRFPHPPWQHNTDRQENTDLQTQNSYQHPTY
jgi:hypothetical protein